MIEAVALAPADRVLVACASALPPLEALAQRLSHGALVVLCAGAPLLREARRRAVPFEHVMAAPGTLEEIPWRDAWFQAVIQPEQGLLLSPRAALEIFRVLTPGGCLWWHDPEGAAGNDAPHPEGFTPLDAPPPWRCYRR